MEGRGGPRVEGREGPGKGPGRWASPSHKHATTGTDSVPFGFVRRQVSVVRPAVCLYASEGCVQLFHFLQCDPLHILFHRHKNPSASQVIYFIRHCLYYRPQTKFGEGIVFTGVCLYR